MQQNIDSGEKELAAKRAFVKEWNLNDKFFEGARIGELPWQKDCFDLDLKRDLSAGNVTSQIDAIQMLGKIRFGNSYMAILHALGVAKATNVNRIFCSHAAIKENADEIIDGIRITAKSEAGLNALKGRFFYDALIKPFLEASGYEKWWNSPYRKSESIFKLFGININEQPLGEKELVIHIRSGDLFEKKSPHPRYAQPPLSFYIEVIKSSDWEKVWLVYENEANPVISALKRWLGKRGIPVGVTSADVSTDVQFCMRARHLVFSTGTFLYPIAVASKNLQTIYRFETPNKSAIYPSWFKENGAKFHLYEDKKGRYRNEVLAEWQNNKKQRRMMLKYPARHLKYQVIDPAAPKVG